MDIRNSNPVMKEKKRPGREPMFSFEFMMMIGKAVTDDGMKYREAAKTFNCSHGLINSARKMYLSGQPTKNHKPEEANYESMYNRVQDQMAKLKQEIGELYIENQMLKKALYVSQQIKKGNSSVITSENLEQYLEAAK